MPSSPVDHLQSSAGILEMPGGRSASPDTIDSTLDVTTNRWHPKLTVYRVIVLSAGIMLGTAKAWETSRGETVIPITLEWISGVVVSLSLFILSWFDEGDGTRPPMSLLFSYDCLDILWRVWDKLSIPRPIYRSDERIHTLTSPSHPALTVYRLSVSAMVVIFGSTKMVYSYTGRSTAASTADWVYGLIVGTSLYVLGLYEDNTCNFLPSLFTTDYSDEIDVEGVHPLYLIPYVLGAGACIAWLFFLSREFLELAKISIPFWGPAPLTFLEEFIDYPGNLLGMVLFFAVGVLPVPPLFYLLWRTGRRIRRLKRGIISIDRRVRLRFNRFFDFDLPAPLSRALTLGKMCAKKLAPIARSFLINFFKFSVALFFIAPIYNTTTEYLGGEIGKAEVFKRIYGYFTFIFIIYGNYVQHSY
ncbi:hypothetical protein BDN70DRAFT_694601 [Pholiota conissans]|uniref:Uncharacterized protein n=1 Tax=Pholiota conissans TaxID=109636 RepID=A0A9P5Z0U9_9AGAR|nr:hypothetical protein BDN70DRAFT_694601 [Pholiota conissans]